MKIDRYLSQKLNFFSFFLVLLVVLIHANNISNRFVSLIPGELNNSIQFFLSGGISDIAVPFFFIISGLLFFKSGDNFSIQDYSNNLRKREKSLLIPYLLVSGGVILFFYCIHSIDSLKPIFNKDLITEKSPAELLYTWLINPMSFQLWYIRNLLIVCIISPAIYYLIKRLGYVYIIIVTLAWLLGTPDIPYFILTTITFFSIGAFIAIKDINISRPICNNKVIAIVLLLVWLIMTFVGSVILYKTFFWNIFIQNISILMGIISVWILYDFVYQLIPQIATSQILKFSFFIFLFHEPTLTIITKILMLAMGASDTSSLIIYFTSFFTTIAFCIAAAYLLQKIVPSVYAIITGNR